MAVASTNSASFMNGVPELLILRLLREREMYGYEIVQAIRSQTGEVVAIGEGVAYPILHALEKSGAITSRRQTVGGRSRIYYALSDQGASRLAELSALWGRVTGAVQQVLGGAPHAASV
jgi:PadR family transcriptional regulator PadR